MPTKAMQGPGPDAVNMRGAHVIRSKMDHLGVSRLGDSPWKGSLPAGKSLTALRSPSLLRAQSHSLLLRGSLALHAQGRLHALALHAQLVHLHAVLLLQRLPLALQLPGLLAGSPGPGTGEGAVTAGPPQNGAGAAGVLTERDEGGSRRPAAGT